MPPIVPVTLATFDDVRTRPVTVSPPCTSVLLSETSIIRGVASGGNITTDGVGEGVAGMVEGLDEGVAVAGAFAVAAGPAAAGAEAIAPGVAGGAATTASEEAVVLGAGLAVDDCRSDGPAQAARLKTTARAAVRAKREMDSMYGYTFENILCVPAASSPA